MNDENRPVHSPVLIVDDEEQFLRSCALTLKADGITNVRTCASGHAARDLLSSSRFSVVLLDINLPDFR
jgi:DNA-binding NtrC family response regulator